MKVETPSFGHLCSSSGGAHIDVWGAGPFYLRYGGKRWKFEDSDMFGPSILGVRGDPLATQPGSRSPFWLAYGSWRNGGRRMRWNGKVCVFDAPEPGRYWKDDRGISHFISDPTPGCDSLGYIEVPRPTPPTDATQEISE